MPSLVLVDGKTTSTVEFCKLNIFTISNPMARRSNASTVEKRKLKQGNSILEVAGSVLNIPLSFVLSPPCSLLNKSL